MQEIQFSRLAASSFHEFLEIIVSRNILTRSALDPKIVIVLFFSAGLECGTDNCDTMCNYKF